MDPPQKHISAEYTPGYPQAGPAGYPGGYPQGNQPLGGAPHLQYGTPVPSAAMGRDMGIPDVPGAAQVIQGMRPPPMAAENIPQIQHLSKLPVLFVRQRIDFMELFVDYDVSNQYDVYLSEESRKMNSRWLYAREESDCMQRVCFPRCREFSMDVGLTSAQNHGPQSIEQQMGLVSSKFVYPMVRIHRPFSCCLQSFTVADGHGREIASGEEECMNLIGLCPTTTHITGPGTSGTGMKYTMVGPSACMINCIGGCPCRGEFDFDMKDTTGRWVGKVVNEPNGCLKMCFTNADDYRVEFDPSAVPAERGALLALAVRLPCGV